jgi:hypothetical protein
MLSTAMSIDFLKRLQTMPSWAEMEYAFLHRLVPIKTVIDYAKTMIAADDAKNPEVVFIASAPTDESIAESVHRLAKVDFDSCQDKIQLFWANAVLAWVYEHRSSCDDLLSVVEEIYADFGYPSELAQFVRYMPSNAPDLGSREANEYRMIASMGRYVAECVLS